MPTPGLQTSGRSADGADRPSASLRAKLARQLDEPSARPFLPPLIPDHTLIRCIGEGACGQVWLANSALGTWRAVKIIYRARFKDDRPYEREFDGILKYEPVSRTHEGLVQVLHVGRKDNARCFYYVMELADDLAGTPTSQSLRPSPQASEAALADLYSPRTLRSELACHRRLAPTDAARLTLGLAKALRCLHEQGLVHRDIKPSNVIFVSGRPKLADIGLVTDIGSSQSFVGTDGFIPPEGPGTPQADLYATGKLLYELATGRDRMDFPQLPPRVQELPDGEALLELNEIITRACAPDPANRYATASQLEAELNLFLAGRSLRRARQLETCVTKIKHFAITTTLLLALTAVALWFSKREERLAVERAQTANHRALIEAGLRRRAQAAERESEQRVYSALLEQARANVRSGDMGQRVGALNAIRRAAAISNHVELRREVMAALALPDLRLERELPSSPGDMLNILDPHFTRIAVFHGSGPVEIRAATDYRLLTSLPATTNLQAFGGTWSRDGRYLAVKRDGDPRGSCNVLEVWAVDESRPILAVQEVVWDARSFHPLEPKIATGSADGAVIVWDLENGIECARGRFEAAPLTLAYSPQGDRLAAAFPCPEGWCTAIQDATGRTSVSTVFKHRISFLEWHPSGQWLAVTDFNGDVHALDSGSGVVRLLGHHKAEAANAVFSPDGDYLLTGGWEREIICWDVRTGNRAMTISADSFLLQFKPDGQACALLTPTGVQFHSFELPTAHRRLTEDLGPRLRHAAFSPDGRWLAASASKRVGIWDLTARTPAALTGVSEAPQLFWTPDSRELFGSNYGEGCHRWRVQAPDSAAPLLQPLPLSKPPGFLSLAVHSNHLVWTGTKGVRLASVDEAVTEEEDWITTAEGMASASPDGRWLGIFRSYGTVLHIYRLPEVSYVTSLTNQDRIAGFSFSPMHDEVAVGTRSQVEFWSTRSWDRTRVVTNSVGIPRAGVLYQPDGRALWLATNFRTAGLYDTHTLEPILFLPTGMFPLALTTDGRQLAVTLNLQDLQVWDLTAVRQTLRETGLDWSEP